MASRSGDRPASVPSNLHSRLRPAQFLHSRAAARSRRSRAPHDQGRLRSRSHPGPRNVCGSSAKLSATRNPAPGMEPAIGKHAAVVGLPRSVSSGVAATRERSWLPSTQFGQRSAPPASAPSYYSISAAMICGSHGDLMRMEVEWKVEAGPFDAVVGHQLLDWQRGFTDQHAVGMRILPAARTCSSRACDSSARRGTSLRAARRSL
jgi:hypothetical protein